jgi:hypothetical protein
MHIKLTVEEVAALKQASRLAGQGGFQRLMEHLEIRLEDDTGEMEIPYLLLERIHRYAFKYRNSSWRRVLRKIFRRTLGANLDRGLKFFLQ